MALTSPGDNSIDSVELARRKVVELEVQVRTQSPSPRLLGELDAAYDNYVRIRTQSVAGPSWLDKLLRRFKS